MYKHLLLNKVACVLTPKIMNFVFPLKENRVYARENNFVTRNVKTVSYGTETLAHLGPNIWSIVPNDMKQFLLSKFAKTIRVYPIKISTILIVVDDKS